MRAEGVASAAARERALSGLGSRVVVAVIGLPLVLGVGWVALGLGYLLLLRGIPAHGRLATFTVLLAVFAGDIAAFFAGRMVGRHKLAPTLSPGKTWEGFVFGTAATVFVAFDALYKQNYVSVGDSIFLGLLIAVAGPLGDLF